MTFLNPAVLFGLLAASIPIVLHFLNLRKLKKINFSTLAFLKELQKTKIKRIKLKQWLLLLLRILIITFLVLAFSRPTVKSFPFATGSAKTSAVFIIDNSFSMSVVNENGTFINQSKQTAKNLLDSFEDGDEITVLPLSHDKNSLPFFNQNFITVKKEIDDIQTQHSSPTLNETLIKAGNILYQSKNFNKEIYIFTDMQKSRLYNSINELSELNNLFGENIHLYIISTNKKSVQNLGIDRLILNNQIFEKNKTISFTSTITNYSEVPVNNSVASLYVNGKRNAQQNVNLMPNESKEFFFETTLTDTGLVEIYTELEDDDIINDNKRHTAFYLPDHYSVLIINDANEDSKFIKLALSDKSGNIKLDVINFSQLPVQNLSRYDAVILFIPGYEVQYDKLLNYLSNGGGLLLFPGSKTSLSSYQFICRALEIDLPISTVGKINSTDSPAQFDKIDMDHPILADLFEDKTKLKVESPDIYYYFRINTGILGRSIISLFDKSSFLSEYSFGKGIILNYSSAPLLSFNNFPVKALFAPLINKSLIYVSSKSKINNEIIAGGEILASINRITAGNIRIIAPCNKIELVDADTLYNKNYFEYNNTHTTGIYKFYSGNTFLDYAVINHDIRESDLQKISELEFEDYLDKIGFNGNVVYIQSSDDMNKAIYQSRYGSELWKFFIMAALILALIEMFVARNTKKELTNAIN